MNVEQAISKLTKLQARVSTAETELSKAKGREEALLESLKQKFGVNNINEGITLLNELNETIGDKERALIAGVSALEEKYDWTD